MMGGSAEPGHCPCFLAHAEWRAGVISHVAGAVLSPANDGDDFQATSSVRERTVVVPGPVLLTGESC